MSHLNINGVDKPLDHIWLNNVRSENLCSVSSVNNVAWAKKQDDILAIINALPVGTYTFSYTATLARRNDSSDSSLYGVRLYKDTTQWQYLNQWDDAEAGDAKNGLATFEITTATVGQYTAFYLYGCGTNQGGATGSADFSNIMLNLGSTALPYQPYLITKEAWEARDKNDHLLWGRADTFTGTNSISARCYGLPVKSWEIDGNSRQSGVPSPDNIIVPTFCGVRTANLVDIATFQDGMHLDVTTGLPTPFGGDRIATIQPIDVSQYSNVKLTFSEITQSALFMWSLFNGDTLIKRVANKYSGTTIDTSNATKMYLSLYPCTVSDVIYIMLNAGNSALPYEPYGYKLTITSAGQTVPVYLGEVPTVRRVKKLVLTGEETFFRDKERADSWRFYSNALVSAVYNVSICSHFAYIATSGVNDSDNIGFSLFSAAQFGCRCPKAIANTITEFKAFLAAQYSAGTPVTVWYVLATPTTGIVNEPLCKIGDYADTLTSDQAGVTIPTTDGNNTITVDTSLAPSRFEVKVHAKAIAP